MFDLRLNSSGISESAAAIAGRSRVPSCYRPHPSRRPAAGGAGRPSVAAAEGAGPGCIVDAWRKCFS